MCGSTSPTLGLECTITPTQVFPVHCLKGPGTLGLLGVPSEWTHAVWGVIHPTSGCLCATKRGSNRREASDVKKYSLVQQLSNVINK